MNNKNQRIVYFEAVKIKIFVIYFTITFVNTSDTSNAASWG